MNRVDSPVEVDYYRNGGILPYVVRVAMKQDNFQSLET